MKQAIVLSIFLLGLFPPTVLLGADVHLNMDQLTVIVQNEPLNQVLMDLARQGQFDLTILQENELEGETISEEFHNLPIHEGVQRLLPAWNYGLTKHKKTGLIRHMFVVSKRILTDELSSPQLPRSPRNTPYVEQPSQSPMTELENREEFENIERDEEIFSGEETHLEEGP